MGRFCYDSAAIRRWKFGPWSFFALTRIAPIHRASFCIQPYSSGSKRFFVQCLASGQSKQCLHDDRTRRFPLFYRHFRQLAFQSVVVFDIKITGTESTKPKLRVIGCYSIRTINTIHIFNRLAFRLYRRKTVKYGVFSLCWCLWRALKQYWIKQQNCLRSFFSTKSYLSNAIYWKNGFLFNTLYITASQRKSNSKKLLKIYSELLHSNSNGWWNIWGTVSFVFNYIKFQFYKILFTCFWYILYIFSAYLYSSFFNSNLLIYLLIYLRHLVIHLILWEGDSHWHLQFINIWTLESAWTYVL